MELCLDFTGQQRPTTKNGSTIVFGGIATCSLVVSIEEAADKINKMLADGWSLSEMSVAGTRNTLTIK